MSASESINMDKDYYLRLLEGDKLLAMKLRVDRIVKVNFPKLNKQNCLSDNDESMVKHGVNQENCRVVKSIAVPPAIYKILGDTLLSDNEIWEMIGGSYSDAPELDGISSMYEATQEQLEIFRATCLTLVVEVINRNNIGQRFYVNTEGHEYARYVGRLSTETGDRCLKPLER